jgi:CRISPR-associated protein Cmr2
VAVLAADGDQMGRTISSIETASEHQEFSRALAGFASNAERVVGGWSGALVYSGGDDVLALLPVDTVIECACSLRESFASALGQWPGPTLSVGIGVGHSIGEDMQDLLAMARAAEKDAKDPDRNGLAFHWATRGADALKLRYRWDWQPHQRLYGLIRDFLAENFPDGAVYQLREMARHYEGWPAANPNLAPAIKADALRLLGRKVATSEPATLQRIRSFIADVSESRGLERLATEMILARRFAAVYRQSERQPGGARNLR